uniref:Mechanosensitive ion channel n=1 Tax=uncultured bacterium W5-51b TaxID=1130999 RepID=H9BX76_9BACT|nr:mechanosensitive ion channel [uncultured bacterium W5-51b]
MALLLGAILAFAPSTSRAHDEPAAEPVVEAVVAIDASQIAAEADLVARSIRAFDQSLAPSATVAAIEEQLPQLVAEIDEQEAQSSDWLDATASLGALSSAQSAWEALRPGLPGWLRELSARLGQVGDALAQLERMDEVWQVTGERLRERAAPDALIASLVSVRANIAGARLRVSERRAALLTLQTAVAEQDGRIERALEEVAAARDSLVGRVFERDRFPIWDPRAFDSMGQGLAQRLGEVVSAESDRLDSFVRGNRGELTFHASLSLLLLAGLHLARMRVRRRTEEEHGLRRVADLFEAPYSVALLLAITASFSIYPYLPPSLVQLLGAVALLPTLRLVRRFSERAFVPLLNALVVFYLVDRLRDLAAPLPTLVRAVFIAEMLVAVGLIGWLLRPARLQHIPAYTGRGMLYLLGLACRTALVVMLAAVAAEALGYSLLGQLIGGAVLESAYVGVLAYAAVRIFDSLSTFALRVPPLGSLGMVQRSRYAMSTQIHRIAVVVASATWAWWALGLFAVRVPIFAAAVGVFTAELEIGTIALSLADLVAFGVTIWLSFVISRFVRFALEEDAYPRLKLARGIPYAASTFAHYTILGLGFFAAVAATGIDLNRFALLAGAFGVGIGFGLQNVVNNFVSGLILLTERPVQVGDTIETEGLLGEVKRIGIRSSTVRTRTGAELIVPNSQLISERVTNWTLSDGLRRIAVTVGVAYGTDVDAVLALLRGVAESNGDVLPDPALRALFTGFGDSSLDFELRVWTTSFDEFARVQSDLNVAINRGLADAEIVIPFPQRDLHVRSVKP